MLGAAGAIMCLAAGTALGIHMRDRRQARLRLLQCEADVLAGMRLLLVQERLAMGELLTECAGLVPKQAYTRQFGERLRKAAEALAGDPLNGVAGAYAAACGLTPMPWEQAEEKDALNQLFLQLGNGTAAMREQAVATCLRRLKPVTERAQQRAEEGGKLCMQLGMLLGLMAGIALW